MGPRETMEACERAAVTVLEAMGNGGREALCREEPLYCEEAGFGLEYAGAELHATADAELVVGHWVYYPGGPEVPPDVDFCEEGNPPTVRLAVTELLLAGWRRRVEDAFDVAYEPGALY